MDKGVTGGDRYTPAAYNKYSYPNTPLQNTYSTRARTSSPPSRIDLSADFIKARTCRDARQKGRTDVGYRTRFFPWRMISLYVALISWRTKNEMEIRWEMISLNWFGLRKENFEYSGCMKEYSSLCIVSIIIIQICKKQKKLGLFSILQFLFFKRQLWILFECVMIFLCYILIHPSKYALMNHPAHTHTSLHFLHPPINRSIIFFT